MPISMVCPNPSCKKQGKLPDTFPGGKVKCPACGTIWTIPSPSATPTSAPTAPRPKTAAPPKPKPAPNAFDAFGLDEGDEPLPAAAPALTRGHAAPVKSSAPSPLLIGMLAVGGVAVVGFVGLMIFLFNSGPAQAPAPASLPYVASTPAEAEAAAAATARAAAAAEPPAEASPVTSYSTPPPAPLPNESPAQTIQRVKNATVYIKVAIGKMQGSGTGFVIKNLGDTTLIATNRHVVMPHLEDAEEREEAGIKPGDQPTISVVFRSGEGSGTEQQIPAELIGIDLTPDHSHDLAILAVKGVKDLPQPIDPAQRVEPVEGMEARIYGFPFGEMLNVAAKGNPAITINKGAVSSLRRNESGGLALIQIDGSVNPGNSGGPIVDEKGRLIGVTVAKLKAADNIGLAVPAAELLRLLDGRVGGARIALKGLKPGLADLEFEVLVTDPFHKLQALGVRVGPSNNQSSEAKPGPDGSYPPISGGSESPLTMIPNSNRASGHVEVPLSGDGNRRLLVQFSHKDAQGRTYLSHPVPYDVPSSPGPLAFLSPDTNLETRLRKTLGRLGPLVDPDGDCKSDRTDKVVKIDLPANKLHILAPQFRDRKNQGMKNAPRMLTPINGDFLVFVRVAGNISPGTEPCGKPRGGKMPFSIQGGGILLWQDKDNYLRLERSCGTDGGLTMVNRLILEICQNGQVSDGGYAYIDIPEGPLYVMLVRTDGKLRCLFSNDGRKWTGFKTLAVEFPVKASVGLSAFNTSKKPFTARFEDFMMIDDREKIDKELQP